MKRQTITLLLALGLTAGHARAGDSPEPTQVKDTQNEQAYFLSSSVPEKKLALLIQAAEEAGIPVYFRGLVGDSMEQTAKFMMHLVTTYKVQGVQIDPIRFEKYGVDQVPALVRKCGEHFDIIYGDIALDQALTMINRRGECRGVKP